MHKIMITGNAGSGKTTLSHKLAKALNRQDVFSLDKVVWKPGWILANREEKELELEKIIKLPFWIIDGVSKKVLEEADAIFFLDYPRRTCYWRALKRNCRYIFRSRPELPENCPEILVVFKLIKIIWAFPKVVRPNILSHLSENFRSKQIFHITNNDKLEEIIKHLESRQNKHN